MAAFAAHGDGASFDVGGEEGVAKDVWEREEGLGVFGVCERCWWVGEVGFDGVDELDGEE